MSQAYSDPERESDPHALPDIEIFYLDQQELDDLKSDPATLWSDDQNALPGYYYWFCFPGCLPDSEPIGPFDTEEEALEDARGDDYYLTQEEKEALNHPQD